MICSPLLRTVAAILLCGAVGLSFVRAAAVPINQSVTIVPAADSTVVRLDGPQTVRIYPRRTGEHVVWLTGAGSSATVTGSGRAIYLMMPPTFMSPGPYYREHGRQRAALPGGRSTLANT